MKKKIWAICLTLVLALAAFAISGCSLFNDVGTISWVKEPAKTYSLNETTKPSFELKVKLKNANSEGKTEITVKYPDGGYDSQIKIDNFTTATVGTRTATVMFEKLTLSFSYKVVDKAFADGTGSSTDPYQIATPEQFQSMLKQKSFNYYKLTKTIDFTDKAIEMANGGAAAADKDAWVGVLDGAGYSVTGISQVLTSDGKQINKYNEMFGRVGRGSEKFGLKDITFVFASEGASATMGLVTCNGTNAVLEFEGVNVTGYINASYTANSQIGPYVTFLERYLPGRGKVVASFKTDDNKDITYQEPCHIKSLTFKNCKNDIRILNSSGIDRVAGYVVHCNDYEGPVAGSIKFVDCEFSGVIEGSKSFAPGAFYTSHIGNNAYNRNIGSEAANAVVMSGCTVKTPSGENNYNIINTVKGLGNGAQYNCGNISIHVAYVDKIKPAINAVFVNEISGVSGTLAVNNDFKKVVVNVAEDLTLTCSVENDAAIDDYKIYVIGGMYYNDDLKVTGDSKEIRNKLQAGAFRLSQPVISGSLVNGVLTQKLIKVGYNNVGTTENTDTTYGSNLIVEENGVLTYYCGTVCKSIFMKEAGIFVVGYKNGRPVAVGQYTKGVNLAA